MRKRRWLLLGIVVFLAWPVLVVVQSLLPAEPGICKANFQRIHVGMTEAEIAALLGGSGLSSDFEHSENMMMWGEFGKNEDIFVYVYFDQQGRVESKCAQRQPGGVDPWPSFLEQLRRIVQYK